MVGDVTLWKAITGAVVSVLALVGWLWRIDSKAEARTAQLRKDLIVHLDGMDSRAEARMAQLRKDLIARLDVMDSMAEARMAQLRKDLKGPLGQHGLEGGSGKQGPHGHSESGYS